MDRKLITIGVVCLVVLLAGAGVYYFWPDGNQGAVSASEADLIKKLEASKGDTTKLSDSDRQLLNQRSEQSGMSTQQRYGGGAGERPDPYKNFTPPTGN
ncbi:MAG: hypothetical protein BGO01_05745 [Armatimonadetes bacterium 55-13]|nr:hypothetical protein [Armatimonadota bacterium]OJU61572.1 MAG: hypothetical protein BGO01_05745 [Armatimonadetes bacterium 55-13]